MGQRLKRSPKCARTGQPAERSVICTAGHSTRSISEFVLLLQSANVERVVDIRSIPKSRRNPDYNLDRLPELLAPYGIGHEYLAELGGRRGKSRVVDPTVNGLWQNQSFHNYADYALSDAFRAGLERLIALAASRRSAIMCAEAVWWRCHRRIVADQLLVRGYTVVHLMNGGRHTTATLTPGAVVDGYRVTYPAMRTTNGRA
jgi:uncharacterized protein (DUF488 family)